MLVESMNRYGIGESVTEEEFVAFMMKRQAVSDAKVGNAQEENDGGNHSDSTVDVAEALNLF